MGRLYGERSRHFGGCRRTRTLPSVALWTNPEGAELRLTVDGKVQLTDVSHHLFALPVVALAWREKSPLDQGMAVTQPPFKHCVQQGAEDFDGVLSAFGRRREDGFADYGPAVHRHCGVCQK